MGGLSKEREISLRSGKAVASALRQKGYEVHAVDVDAKIIDILTQLKPDAVYLALHGKFGEDGVMQGVLEWLKIPYSGSSVLSSAVCFDKLITKELAASHGIETPAYAVYREGESSDEWVKNFPLSYPVIVKPNTEGSSIGVTRVFKKEELSGALQAAACLDKVVLVEQLIQGREVTVGIFNGKALPVVEVIPKSGFYDFSSKYTKGMTDYQVPAKIKEKTTKILFEKTRQIFDLLGCEGGVRADFMLDANEKPYFLEINTIPGMTETSLLPKAAASAGISFEDLCEEILKGARLKIT